MSTGWRAPGRPARRSPDCQARQSSAAACVACAVGISPLLSRCVVRSAGVSMGYRYRECKRRGQEDSILSKTTAAGLPHWIAEEQNGIMYDDIVWEVADTHDATVMLWRFHGRASTGRVILSTLWYGPQDRM